MKDLFIRIKDGYDSTVSITRFVAQWNISSLYHNHNFFEFIIPVAGYAENIYNGITHPLSVGQIILMRPDDTHQIRTEETDSFERPRHIHYDIYVPIEKMQNICNSLSDDLYQSIISAEEPISFDVEISKIQILKQQLCLFNNNTQIDKLEALHTCIIYEILSYYYEFTISRINKYPDWLNSFILQLNSLENMSKKINELYPLVHYSRGYLSREFKKYTGKSLEHYIIEIRINQSYSLLMQSELSLTEIAILLGYDSLNSFSMNFKKYTGVTPSAWKKYFIESSNKQFFPNLKV